MPMPATAVTAVVQTTKCVSLFISLSSCQPCRLVTLPNVRVLPDSSAMRMPLAGKAGNPPVNVPSKHIQIGWKETTPTPPLWYERKIGQLVRLPRTTLGASHRRSRCAFVQLLGFQSRLFGTPRGDTQFVHLVTEHSTGNVQRARCLGNHSACAPQRLLDGAPLQILGDLRQIQTALVKSHLLAQMRIGRGRRQSR